MVDADTAENIKRKIRLFKNHRYIIRENPTDKSRRWIEKQLEYVEGQKRGLENIRCDDCDERKTLLMEYEYLLVKALERYFEPKKKDRIINAEELEKELRKKTNGETIILSERMLDKLQNIEKVLETGLVEVLGILARLHDDVLDNKAAMNAMSHLIREIPSSVFKEIAQEIQDELDKFSDENKEQIAKATSNLLKEIPSNTYEKMVPKFMEQLSEIKENRDEIVQATSTLLREIPSSTYEKIVPILLKNLETEFENMNKSQREELVEATSRILREVPSKTASEVLKSLQPIMKENNQDQLSAISEIGGKIGYMNSYMIKTIESLPEDILRLARENPSIVYDYNGLQKFIADKKLTGHRVSLELEGEFRVKYFREQLGESLNLKLIEKREYDWGCSVDMGRKEMFIKLLYVRQEKREFLKKQKKDHLAVTIWHKNEKIRGSEIEKNLRESLKESGITNLRQAFDWRKI